MIDAARCKLILSASAGALAMGAFGHASAQQVPADTVLPAGQADGQANEQGANPPVLKNDKAPAEELAPLAAPSPPPVDVMLPVVQPIIDDVEFRRAIPKISVDDDPELNQPLESIAEFQRRKAAEMAEREAERKRELASGSGDRSGTGEQADDPASPSTPSPNEQVNAQLAGQSSQNTVEAPVVDGADILDAELMAPLPALESFDVTPVTFAEAEDEGRNRELRYEISVVGMEQADEESDVSLKNLFKELSTLQAGKGKAENIAMLRARLNADGELVQRIMISEGYYDAGVDTKLDWAGAGNPTTATINVVPGIRYQLSSIKVVADPTIPPDLIEKNFPLQIGEPIVAERVLGAEAALALKLPEAGYPFSEIGDRDILLDGITGEGEYMLPVTIGPRARIGSIETSGDLAFDREHVELLARFDHGDVYNSLLVDDLRQALVTTGLFSSVSAEPQRTGELASDGSEFVTLMVTQDAGPPRTIAGNIGYGTGQGARVQGSWTHRNFFPPEGALIAGAVLGTQEQRASVTMRRSNAGKRDRTFEVVGEASRSNYDAFEALTGRVGFRVSRDSTQIWQKPITYAYGAEFLATREDDYNFVTNVRERDFYMIAGITGQLGLDRTDSLLDATKGFRMTAVVRPEGSLSGKFTPYVVTQVDGSVYYPVMESLVLAGRIRVGSILGAEREKLAPSRRFYGGGGGSVRGFGYQKLGPKDPNLDPIGGRAINEVAVEARYRFGNFGIVSFLDAGQVYRSSTPDFSSLRFGAGIGGRFYTSFGPMRLDVATPINRQPGESRVSVYISIGQAF